MKRIGILCATVFFASLCCMGQVNTGKISGFVSDAGEAMIPGVPVVATNDSIGVATTGSSSETGEYLLNFLVPGSYHVKVEQPAFQTVVRADVIVNAGITTRVDFALRVGQAVQTVVVESNPITVATESSELSQTFSSTELETLPNLDHNPLFQMNLIPGANNDAGSGNYGANGGENGSALGQSRSQLASIGGVDANANTVYIEGVPNREPQNGYISSATFRSRNRSRAAATMRLQRASPTTSARAYSSMPAMPTGAILRTATISIKAISTSITDPLRKISLICSMRSFA